METTHKSFEEALAYGEDGEKQIAEYLMAKGVSIIPFYQFNPNQAPFLLADGQKYVLPDLLCSNMKKVFFVECKRKKRWVSFRGRIETGFSNRLLEQYKKVQEFTGIHIFPFFLMENCATHAQHTKYEDALPSDGLYVLPSLNVEGRLWNGRTPQGKYIEPPIYLWQFQKLLFLKNYQLT